MRRILAPLPRLIVPALIIVEILLVRGHYVRADTALALVALFEGALFLGTLAQIGRAVWVMRRGMAQGRDFWAALEDGLAIFFPRPVARLLAIEPRFWYCLVRWIFARPRPTPTRFTYHRGSMMGIFLIAVLFTAPVEFLLVDLLVPWPWLKITLIVAEIYTALWLCGYTGSLAVLPYELRPSGVLLRHGLLAEVFVPYTDIAAAQLEKRSPKNQREGLSHEKQAKAVLLVVGGTTHVTLDLRTPLAVHGLLRDTPPVTTLALAADDPRGLVAALTARIPIS